MRWLLALTVLAAVAGCRRVSEDVPKPRATPASTVEPNARPAVTPNTARGTTVVVPDFARVAKRIDPSVVTVISTVRDRDNARRTKAVRGLGSGLIVTATGQVLTNEHVIASAKRVDVELADLDRVGAKVVVADPLLDLALLQIEGNRDDLAPAEFSTRDATPGEWVMAVGQPFGLGHTVTVGVIGGLGRDHDDLGRPDGLRSDGIWSFIQTDASINIGNSGGPLVDADGQVIGITTAVRSDGQGLAFAIPGAMVRRFLEEAWTYGRVRHARLGINADNAPAGALPGHGRVVRVTQVEDGGPGAKAGLAVGDFILAIDETPVTRVSDVAYLTQLLGVGARMTMTIRRGDQPQQQVLVIPAEIK